MTDNGVPIGATFKDLLGDTYTVVGEPRWVENMGEYVQDVSDESGWVVANAVPALRIYLGREGA